eukprot:TRINITY_DN27972_c0_g1_i1.p1 TRINITY_DN27972_c0_g1~~TRINITY_DN27972_c0_g1_i1.p1  ORF type:complete len:134 (-),score=36.25 TRINITY_DN27972_c0_g1_i1:72-473(-)
MCIRDSSNPYIRAMAPMIHEVPEPPPLPRMQMGRDHTISIDRPETPTGRAEQSPSEAEGSAPCEQDSEDGRTAQAVWEPQCIPGSLPRGAVIKDKQCYTCLLYTSDAADDLLCVDLGGRRIIQKKKIDNNLRS